MAGLAAFSGAQCGVNAGFSMGTDPCVQFAKKGVIVGKFVFAIAALALIGGCSKSKEEIDREINTSAFTAASMLVAAYRSCQRVGIARTDACAKSSGQLVPEQIARTLAVTALEWRDGFLKNCYAAWPAERCDSTLERSAQIAWNTPPSQ